jgi:hypothetical protein
MKVVLMKEEDGADLLRRLELQSLSGCNLSRLPIDIRDKLTEAECKELVKAIHGSFVYHAVGWLNEHGFKVN